LTRMQRRMLGRFEQILIAVPGPALAGLNVAFHVMESRGFSLPFGPAFRQAASQAIPDSPASCSRVAHMGWGTSAPAFKQGGTRACLRFWLYCTPLLQAGTGEGGMTASISGNRIGQARGSTLRFKTSLFKPSVRQLVGNGFVVNAGDQRRRKHCSSPAGFRFGRQINAALGALTANGLAHTGAAKLFDQVSTPY